jgi:hypothetical protein
MEEDDLEDEETKDQPKNKRPRITASLPYTWKKGQNGNPAGRPKGCAVTPSRPSTTFCPLADPNSRRASKNTGRRVA